MDKKAIETLSVNAVRDSIVQCALLDQFIPDNDKEPSWDGHVYAYKNSSKRKEAFLFRKIRPFICRNFRQNSIESAIIIADFQKK